MKGIAFPAKIMASLSSNLLSDLRRGNVDALELSRYMPNGLNRLPDGCMSIDDVIRMFAEFRRRPIEVVGMPLPVGVTGARAAGPTKDFIFHENRTPRAHQDHIKAHELSHIIAGHRVAIITGGDETSKLLLSILMRSDDEKSYEEREAEALAKAIQAEIIRIAGLRGLTHQVSTSKS